MPIELIRDKLKELGMSDEDLAKFADSVTETINEAVDAKVKSQVDAEKKKYDVLAEEYCNKKIAEGVDSARTRLIKEYDKKMMMLENKYISKLDRFIDSELVPQVSDETIGKIALNESLAPVVNGIRRLLEEHHIVVDSDGSALLSEAKREIVKLKKNNSELMEQKMTLTERLDKVASHMLMTEATEGLTPSEKKRVQDHFKGKGFDEIEERVKPFVGIILEARDPKKNRPDSVKRKRTLVESSKPTPPQPKTKVPNPEEIMVDPNEVMQEMANQYI